MYQHNFSDHGAHLTQLSSFDSNYSKMNALFYHYFLRQEYEECLNKINIWSKGNGNNNEFMNFLKALVLRVKGKLNQSVDCLKKSHIINEKNVETLKQIAKTLGLVGRHRAALEVIEEAEKLASTDWEVYYNKGLIMNHLKNFNEAEEQFKKAKGLSQNVCIFIHLAKLYQSTNRSNQALETLIESTKLTIDNSEIYMMIGMIYLRAGDGNRAFQYFAMSLSSDPKNTKTLMALGSISQDRDDNESALNKYKIANSLNPNSAQLWNNIGMCFYSKEKFLEALSCLKKAHYLDPFEWLISFNLGLIYMALNQYASAFHHFYVAISFKNDNAHLYMYLALCLNRLDDFPNACESMNRALELGNDELILINYAIMLASRPGNENEARKRIKEFDREVEKAGQNTLTAEMQESREKLKKMLGVQKYSTQFNRLIVKKIENNCFGLSKSSAKFIFYKKQNLKETNFFFQEFFF